MQGPQDVVVVALKRPFPEDLWHKLTGLDLHLLDELAFLCRKQAERSPTGAKYCTPGRKYLAGKLGVSVSTISRHVSKLRSLGMLEAFQRRPVRGVWQSNLYRLTSWLSWRLAAIRDMVRKVGSRVAMKAHKASLRKLSLAPSDPTGDASASDILAKWRSRGGEEGS